MHLEQLAILVEICLTVVELAVIFLLVKHIRGIDLHNEKLDLHLGKIDEHVKKLDLHIAELDRHIEHLDLHSHKFEKVIRICKVKK